MQTTSKNIFHRSWFLSIAAGASVFLAFEEFGWVPVLLLFPAFFNSMVHSAKDEKHAFVLGFLTSFIIMLGGFYWVTYVIHEFGNMSWLLSGALFLCFCGFGALNFPFFATICFWIQRRFLKTPGSLTLEGLWYSVGVPALFTICEWFIPKLFPWFISHAFYRQLWLIQICEITGASFLTFSLYSLGSSLDWIRRKPHPQKQGLAFLAVPISCLLLTLFFSYWTFLHRRFPEGKDLKVALVQANIGSLDKLKAQHGMISIVDKVVSTYETKTRMALSLNPDLILWPETAVPLEMNESGQRQGRLISFFQEINTPVITGAYASSPYSISRNYNSAFLFDPTSNPLHIDTYHKNILLAFGEYLPLGDTFPSLYKAFPQVSDFERGKKQNVFTLSDGTKLGVSICYEAIVPSFVRKIGMQGVHALVNLTNDSWFGPTSEPHLHGALSIFRAIEHRVPLLRVTNTGASFVVDHLGQMSDKTAVYQEENLVRSVKTIVNPHPTFYASFGDWFIALISGFLLILIFIGWRNRESLPL